MRSHWLEYAGAPEREDLVQLVSVASLLDDRKVHFREWLGRGRAMVWWCSNFAECKPLAGSIIARGVIYFAILRFQVPV